MPRIQKQSDIKPAIRERIFTEQELQEFHQDIESNYRQPYTLTNGKEARPVDWKKLHIDKRTMTKHGAVIIEWDTFGEQIQPTRYDRLENKIRQYLGWLGRKEYIENEKINQLMQIAQEHVGNQEQ